MTAAYLTLTLLASVAALGGAVLNLTAHRIPVAEARALGVPMEWLTFPIGTAYGLGLLGLMTGLAVPAVGIVAAAGFVMLFVLAIGAHLRVGDRRLARPAGGLALAVATLVATAMYAAGQDDLGGVAAAYVNELPDPWWPVLLLAVVQAVDAALCLEPAGFIAQCFTDVGLPRALWPVMAWVKVAAVLGLIAGLWVPYVAALTSAALVVYFVLAVSAHLRARDPSAGSGHRIGRNLLLNATFSLVGCVAVLVFCFLR